MQLPFPSGMELPDWQAGVCLCLGALMPIPTSLPANWQEWGVFFFDYPPLQPLNPPNPYQYDNWVEWGERLVDTFNNADGVLKAKLDIAPPPITPDL